MTILLGVTERRTDTTAYRDAMDASNKTLHLEDCFWSLNQDFFFKQEITQSILLFTVSVSAKPIAEYAPYTRRPYFLSIDTLLHNPIF